MSLIDNIKSELGKSLKTTSTGSGATLPTELPTEYTQASLTPVFGKTPERQLEEYRVRFAANKVGLDPHLAAAVAQQESGFNPIAVSPTGVKGTMQVTKKTASSLGFNRDNPDENILAGVSYLKQSIDKAGGDIKQGLSAYPDPKDWKHWSKNVLANYNLSTSGNQPQATKPNLLLEAIKNDLAGTSNLASSLPPSISSQSSEATPLQKAVSLAEGASKGIGIPNPVGIPMAGYSAIKSLFTGEPVNPPMTLPLKQGMEALAEQPIAQRTNEMLRSLLGDKRSFTETATQAQPQVSQAITQAPGYNLGGEIGVGFVPGNPLTALPGMVLAPAIAKAGQGVKGIGSGIANIFARQPMTSEVGATIASKAPRMTVAGIKKAAEADITSGQAMIDKVLKTNPDFKLGLREIAQDPDLYQMAIKYEQAGEKAVAKRMLNKLADFEQTKLDATDANELRKTLWELSKYTTKGDIGSGAMAQFNNALGQKVRERLVSELGSNYELALAKQSKNIPVAKAMEKIEESRPTWLNTSLRGVAAALTKGLSEVPMHAATATPVASALYQTGRGVEGMSPYLGQILSALGLTNLKK